MRFIFWVFVAAVAVLATCTTASAQQTLPFSNVQQSPTVSPYLNLLRGGSSSLPSYQTLVQPLLQQQQQSSQQQAQISRLQRQQGALAAGGGLSNPARGAATSIRGTGHVTAFMDYSHYYAKPQAH